MREEEKKRRALERQRLKEEAEIKRQMLIKQNKKEKEKI